MSEWKTVIFLLGYFVLMYYVLPKLGVPTWMNNSCSVPNKPKRN